MTDYARPQQTRKARKEHRCTYCGETILKGETYLHHTGVSDHVWYVSKMHQECNEDLADSGECEYMQYANERPTKEAP